ncbi:peroxiredoxin-like family protein [Streptacidiphilus jiangxiensis]|uniref:thioredoxin-dependent peroxiredoxin n=1 Tax=Streptacidiphilus jiangxiensis TaxID=235985 RepID=A0A1H7WFX7_STRJI|nr:peroxiredoxin-like family protein [Streptacidiphilus jiangxiensis]SEM19777.1 Peroxiredoxin [Streptacidiphilus jiangxiensis]
MTTTGSTVAAQIDAMHHQSAGRLPADVLAAFSDEQQQLDAAGVPAGVAPVGSVMPDGDLLDVHGEPTTLTAARDGRPAVVVFYRGTWCPYCNIALRAYQEQLQPALDARGVALVAISPQTPDGSLTMQQTKELTFTVLSDPGNQIARALGILTAPTESVRQAQATLGLDLTTVNADRTPGLPMPTVAVVDATGVLRWIDVHPNYATRTEPAAILAALATLD